MIEALGVGWSVTLFILLACLAYGVLVRAIAAAQKVAQTRAQANAVSEMATRGATAAEVADVLRAWSGASACDAEDDAATDEPGTAVAAEPVRFADLSSAPSIARARTAEILIRAGYDDAAVERLVRIIAGQAEAAGAAASSSALAMEQRLASVARLVNVRLDVLRALAAEDVDADAIARVLGVMAPAAEPDFASRAA